ncbi:UV DNA damage repair endonuclease UvsE [Segetibacter sp. 3557_3]|uniref:UV DNA damage repair endonuclease UvsE n=1 Tax=Segetibacter sp. 3557_3 TaxID=2547429 RepID=UPI001058B55D|nr:UV DNA damage repair endonuclease UvsE [Segetibacter sp. 3557_3]TDH26619.1 UV DNA damage repair endonuclease UvsE [Segetibacter sp. 3557_3]
MRFGYACINLSLAADKVKVNRSTIKRIFLEKGIAYTSTLALANITDFEKVIDWNTRNKILMYRMSSDMIPWMSEYEIEELPDYETIRKILARCGEKVAKTGQRLTYHPGPFNILAANSDQVVTNTTKELRQHAEIMDLLDLPRTPFAKINIHVGGAYGDKISALARFAENFTKLPDNVRSRLTVENDDKANMFSVQDLLWLHNQVNIPVVFDYFHHGFCTGGLTEEEAFRAAIKTWPADITPVVHFSSPKKKYEDPAALATAHADYLYSHVNRYNHEVDVMFEAKSKEAAVIRYLKEYRVKGYK